MTSDRSSGGRILRRDEVGRLREADSILRDAEATRQRSQDAAVQMEKTAINEARRRALQESARTASRLIARAEEAAEARLRNMEPELARLIAQTVRTILGNFEPEEATYLAALHALTQMRDHRKGRIFASDEMVGPVRRAVDALGPDGPEILSVISDPALDPGRAVLTSDRGSVEIGLGALTDRALRAWEEQEDPAPMPSALDGDGLGLGPDDSKDSE